MKKINFLITDKYCGKTTLFKKDLKYIDLDIIFQADTFRIPEIQETILFFMNAVLDREPKTVFMINFENVEKFDFLKQYFDLEIECYIPELTEENREFRRLMGGGRIKRMLERADENFYKRNQNFIDYATKNSYKIVFLSKGNHLSKKVKNGGF